MDRWSDTRALDFRVLGLPSSGWQTTGVAWAYALLVMLAVATNIASLTMAYMAGSANGGLFHGLIAQPGGPVTLEPAIGASLGLLMSCVKVVLPVTMIGARKRDQVQKVGFWGVWLLAVAYCSAAATGAVMVHRPGLFSASPTTFIWLATGWLLLEVVSGLLPVIAITAAPAARIFPDRAAQPSKRETFGGDVAALLDHVLSNGPEGREGLALIGCRTILCTQAALAGHAGCSKTEAHRQLGRLECEGQIGLTTNLRGTQIEVYSTPLGRRTSAPLSVAGTLLGTPTGTDGTRVVPI